VRRTPLSAPKPLPYVSEANHTLPKRGDIVLGDDRISRDDGPILIEGCGYNVAIKRVSMDIWEFLEFIKRRGFNRKYVYPFLLAHVDYVSYRAL